MNKTKLLLIALLALVQAGLADSRPNIVVFFTDDLDFDETPRSLYDLEHFPSHTGMKEHGFYADQRPMFDKPQGDFFENTDMIMPHLEKLAEQGAIMNRFYITSPICTPSRYSMLTGRFASRSIGFQQKQPAGKPASIDWSANLNASENTLPKELQKCGYFTGMVGKWHNGNGAGAYNAELRKMKISDPDANEKVKEAQRIECETMCKEQGFDYAASLYMGNVGAMKVPKELRHENLEWVTQGAIDFLDQSAKNKDGKPFYLYIALPMPHRQFYDPQARNKNADYWYNQDPRATPGGYLNQVPDCVPSRQDVVRRCDEAGLPRVNTMGTYIDDSLGAVMNKLEELGVADNTLFVFTSDHQSRAKNTVSEAARVPCVIRWPGNIAAGTRKTGIGSNVDLVPTFLEIAGWENEESDVGEDGQSMLPLLTGKTDKGRDSLYLEVMHNRAIVTDRYKYIACRAPADIENRMRQDAVQAMEQKRRRRVSWDGRTNTPDNVSKGVIMDGDREIPGYFDKDQLYDLEKDPFEQHNLADDPAYQDQLTNMKALLKGYLADMPHPFGEFN